MWEIANQLKGDKPRNTYRSSDLGHNLNVRRQGKVRIDSGRASTQERRYHTAPGLDPGIVAAHGDRLRRIAFADDVVTLILISQDIRHDVFAKQVSRDRKAQGSFGDETGMITAAFAENSSDED